MVSEKKKKQAWSITSEEKLVLPRVVDNIWTSIQNMACGGGEREREVWVRNCRLCTEVAIATAKLSNNNTRTFLSSESQRETAHLEHISLHTPAQAQKQREAPGWDEGENIHHTTSTKSTASEPDFISAFSNQRLYFVNLYQDLKLGVNIQK